MEDKLSKVYNYFMMLSITFILLSIVFKQGNMSYEATVIIFIIDYILR